MIYRMGDMQVQTASDDFFVADGAVLVGNIWLGEGVSVWFNAVIRGDIDQIRIGDESNIQDGAVLHVDPGKPLVIGRGVTVGHKAMLHGCEIGDYSLIGINAVVLSGAKIGSRCLIGANTLIPENAVIPDGSLVIGQPGRVKREVSEREWSGLEVSARHYAEAGRQYRREARPDPRYHPDA